MTMSFTLAEKNFILSNINQFSELAKLGRLGPKALFIFNFLMRTSDLVYRTKEEFLAENKEYSVEGDVSIKIEEDRFGHVYRTIYYQGQKHQNSNYLYFPMLREGVNTGNKSGSWSVLPHKHRDVTFRELYYYGAEEDDYEVRVLLTNWVGKEGEIEISSLIYNLKEDA